jgi:hypothetical protein
MSRSPLLSVDAQNLCPIHAAVASGLARSAGARPFVEVLAAAEALFTKPPE